MTKARELSELGSYLNVSGGIASVNNITVSSNLEINVVVANGSVGTAGQMLTSNGTGVYWLSPQLGDITNVIAGTGLTGGGSSGEVTVSLATSGVVANTYGNSSSIPVITVDTYGRLTNVSTTAVAGVTNFTYTGANNTFSISTGDGSTFTANITAANATLAGVVTVLDSVTNTSVLIAASANSVKNAYDRAIDANTRAASAQTAAISAYSNATSYADSATATAYSNAVSVASTDATNKAANAYSNAVSYAATIAGTAYSNAVSTAAADATSKANNAYTTAVSAASTDATNKAANAYSNATTFASNASNISSGTLAEARLPFRMNQNVRTTDTVQFGNMTVTGNLTVTGTTVTVSANNLVLQDNMIYLNDGNTVANPDLGIAGNYNDGTYRHAGFFRDATDGVWKVYDQYLPEPDASPYIDTSNTSFRIADFQANAVTMGSATISGNVGIGTGSPAGKLAVASSSSNGTTISAWSSSHAIFGPNVGSSTGAALGLGYNTTTDTAEIVSIAPNVAWKNLWISAVTTDLNTISGRVQTNQSFRAPIFYDSDNTGFYLNPNDLSNVYQLQATNYLSAPTYYSQGDFNLLNTAGNGYNQVISRQSGDNWIVYGGGSVRAPVFYDSDNTAYFLDAASGSTSLFAAGLLRTYGAIQSGYLTGGVAMTNNDGYGNANITWNHIGGTPEQNGNSARITVNTDSTSGAYMDLQVKSNVTSGVAVGLTSALTAYETYTEIKNSTRSPIYYDSNNTAYWVDPASNSVLTSFNLGGGEVYVYSGSTNALNIRTGAGGSYKYFGFGTDGRFTAGNGGITATSDVNGTIFYDYDNTGYYVDPNGTSNLFQMYLQGGIASSTDSASYVDAAIEIRERNFGGAQADSFNNAPRLGFHWGGRVALQFALTSGGILNLMNGDCTAFSAMRVSEIYANALYDRNNTAYYVDPASTSILNALTVGGSAVMRGVGTAASTNVDWNDLGNTVNTIYQINQETFNLGTGSGNSNFPSSASYKYGTLINFSANNDARAQVYISHAGNDLIFRGGWTTSSWQTWNKVLTDQNYNSYAPTLTGTGASGTWGISISGTAATATALASTTNFFINRGNVAAASIDTATGLGVWNQLNVGDSHTILAFGASGSTSTVQQRFHYTGSMEFRNQTDSANWTAWKTVLTSANFASYAISGATGTWNRSQEGQDRFFFASSGRTYYKSGGGHEFRSAADGNIGIIDNDGTWYNYASVRSPIFYDQDNTAYYLNGNGSSNVLGEFNVQQSGINGFRITSTSGTQSLWVRAGYDTDGSATPAVSATNIQFQSSGSSGGTFTFVTGNTKALTIAGDYAQGAGSVRAPIFYDSNNTGFYIDPNSTSLLNIIAAYTGISAFDGGVVAGDPYGMIAVTRRTDANYSYFGLTRAGQLGMGMGIDTSNQFWVGGTTAGYNGTRSSTYFITTTSGDLTAAGSMRAPIFYDSNDTTYFMDPANNVDAAAKFAGGIHVSIGNTSGRGIILADDGDIVDMNDGYCSMRFSLGVRVRTGNRSGDPMYELNSVYGSSNLENSRGLVINGNYTDGRYSTRLRKWDDGGGVPLYVQQTIGTAGSWANVASFGSSNNRYSFHVDGIAYAGTDIRAPLYYDANDTNFYMNPNGFSRVQTFGVVGQREYPGSINSDWEGGYYHFGPDNNTPTGGYGHAHIIRLSADWNVQMFFPTSNTNEPFWLRRKQNGTYSAWRRMIQEDEWMGNKYFASDGSIYGTIFYDTNNTGYYLNPNGLTFVDSLITAGNITARGDLIVGEAGVDGASYIYMQDADEGQRIIHCNSNRIGFLTQGGAWGSWCDDDGSMMTDHYMRSPIYYDHNDTGKYLDPNGSSILVGTTVVTRNANSNDTFGGLEMRENALQGAATGAATEAPGINFHWSFRAASRIYMDAGGNFVLGAQNDITNGRRNLSVNELTAAGNITAYSSDKRLKTNVAPIQNALDKVMSIGGYTFDWIDGVEKLGFTPDHKTNDAGVLAQEIEAVLPQAVAPAPFDQQWNVEQEKYASKSGEDYLTVRYERIVPLLIEAIKELKAEIEELKANK